MPDEVLVVPTTPTEVQPQITPEIIAAAVHAGISAHTQQTESAPREMTPEQRAEYFQVFDPNSDGFLDSFVEAVRSEDATPEQRAKAIEHLRDGLVNQSIRGAQILVDQRIQEMETRMAPALRRSIEEESEALWGKFAEKFPDLKEHRDLVNAISTQLQASGLKPKDMDDAFTRAAETTRAVIGKITGKPPVASAATPTAPNTMPRMTQTNTSHAAGSSDTTQGKQPGVASFFLKRGGR